MKRKYQIILCIFVLVIVGVFCGKQAYAKTTDSLKSVKIQIENRNVNSKTITLEPAHTVKLKVACSPAKAKKKITFRSSDKSVATVNSLGKVKVKKAGKAKITVTVSGKNKKITTWVKVVVKIQQPKRAFIANRNSGKLHYFTCPQLPFEQNRIYYDTKEEAYAAGYTNEHRECMRNR